jgi:microcystin-dependent protein
MTGSLAVPNIELTNPAGQLKFSDGTYQNTALSDTFVSLTNNTVTNTQYISKTNANETLINSDLKIGTKLIFPNTLGSQNYPYTDDERTANLLNVTKTTAITYDSGLSLTKVSNNLFCDTLTCGNMNTSHLTSTTSNLQNQINNLQSSSSATKYITADDNNNTTIGGTITTGNINAGGNLNAGGNVTAGYDVTINGASVKNSVVPVGTIQMYAGTTAPAGFLLCNGASVSKTSYASLYAVIGDAFRYGTQPVVSTSFYIPDLRGMFVRGCGVNNTYGQISGGGPNPGVYLPHNVQNHSHKYDKASTSIQVVSSISSGVGFTYNSSSVYDNVSVNVNTGTAVYDIDGTSISGNETRPHSVGINYIIKY